MPALILLSYVSLLSLGLIDNVRGPFFPDILTDLNLNGTMGSAFFATTSLVATLGSFSAHRLQHRISSLHTLLLASLVFGAGFMAISMVESFFWLVVSCAFFGWGFGVLNVSQNVLVCEAASARLRRRYLNGLHAMYGLSALLAPLLASMLRAVGMDWRACFMFVGIFPIVIAVIGQSLKPAKGLALTAAVRHPRLTRSQMTKVAGFAALMAAYLWGELSISTRLVLWARTERGFNPESADYLLAGFFLALLAGRMFFGLLHFERLSNWSLLIGSAFLSAALYAAALFVSPWYFVACGLALAPFYPVVMDQVSVVFGVQTGQALGWIIGAGNCSLVAMHVTIGWLTDRLNLSWALCCGVGALLIVGLALSLQGLQQKMKSA